ncbi:hypothetical protein BJF78_22240 [Pseudonocardia sp. CNS-139]|nr:hypothetical protein BJF78_22240 [Pseudonocardia sp. CNS-139]
MRVLLRLLAPLLGIAMAALGALVALEVIATWAQPGRGRGLIVPWPDWRATVDTVTWDQPPVAAVAIGVAAGGLLLVLVGLLARRPEIPLDGPVPEITVTTSPRVLARLVGRRVRAADDVAGATVTASRRHVAVKAQAWDAPGPDLRDAVRARVEELLDELPLHRRPRVTVTVHEWRGPR